MNSDKENTNLSVTERLKIIHGMMDNMNSVDRQVMSDKLLSYLLFDLTKEVKSKNANAESKKGNKKKELTAEEIRLIKELSKRTEDLKNLLGDNPDLFR
jgi:hypothetical protein